METNDVFEKLLKKIVLPQYPMLNDVRISKLYWSGMLIFHVTYQVEMDLNDRLKDKILTETKSLLSMLALENKPSLSVHFSKVI